MGYFERKIICRSLSFVVCYRVAEKERQNKMSVLNIASIFGPLLMKLDSVCSD